MAHSITAMLVNAAYDASVASQYDLRPVVLTPALTMFHVDHYVSAYWQAAMGATDALDVPASFPATFPREGALHRIASGLVGNVPWALVMTEYFGGLGDQWAAVFRGGRRTSADDCTINQALAALGIARRGGMDEFDTVGLHAHRSQPEYLHRYVALCDDLGV